MRVELKKTTVNEITEEELLEDIKNKRKTMNFKGQEVVKLNE